MVKEKPKSMSMPAIVLTCDEYRPFTENMIKSYEEVWPTHPFVFYVPFQENSSLSALVPRARVNMVRSQKSIKDTVMALLDSFGDDEFVFWCIDDYFPIAANAKKLETIFEPFLTRNSDCSKVTGLAFTRAGGLIGPPNLHSTSELLLDWRLFRRLNLNGFWYHQIVRVGVLRYFYSQIPQLVIAKDYDHWKKKASVPENLFVTRETLISYAESTYRGKATVLALKAMRRRNILPPLEHVSPNPPKLKRIGYVGGRLSRLIISVGFLLRRIREYIRLLRMRNSFSQEL